MLLIHAFSGIFSLIIVVLLGFFLTRRGWFDAATQKLLPRLVTNVSLPPFLFFTILTSFPEDDFLNLLKAVSVPFFIIGSMFLLAFMFGKIFKVNKRHFGLFCAAVANSNTIFIGIPVNMAIFGQEALPYVLFYYFAATVFFWTIGNYFIMRDERQGKQGEIKSGFRWNQIISAPILGCLAGLFCIILNIAPPQFLMRAAELVGQTSTPLALIFIGITLANMNLAKFVPHRDVLFTLLGRLVVCPLFALLCMRFFHLPELMAKVYIMQSALPVLMQVSILSAYYNTDPEYGAIIVALTTLGCVITVPIWVILI